MLRIRIISSLVLAPPVLAAAWVGSWAFALLVGIAAILLAWEWTRVCEGRFGRGGVVLEIMGISVALLAPFHPWMAFIPIVIAAVLAPLVARDARSPLWLTLGAIYIGVPLLSLVWLRGQGREMLLWLLLLVWATDIGAYFSGRTIGGPKLAPRISPNKTWAGLAGGMLCAGVVGALVSVLTGCTTGPLTLGMISAALAAVAQMGDLAESSVKRHFGTKDSGNLIPGHGGLFDRVDGLMAAAPVMAFVCLMLGDVIRFAR